MQRRMVERARVESADSPTSSCKGHAVSGERLVVAREADREWREGLRRRLQGAVDRVSERELQARWVCQCVAYLLANALLMVLIVVAADASAGVIAEDFFRSTLPLLLSEILLVAGVVWGAYRLRRVRIQRQARALGADVTLPRELQCRARETATPTVPRTHAVEHLLKIHRARNVESSPTRSRSTRGSA